MKTKLNLTENKMVLWVVRSVSGVTKTVYAKSAAEAEALFNTMFRNLKSESKVVNRWH